MIWILSIVFEFVVMTSLFSIGLCIIMIAEFAIEDAIDSATLDANFKELMDRNDIDTAEEVAAFLDRGTIGYKRFCWANP